MAIYLNGQLVIADDLLVTGDVVLLGGGNIETVANNDLTLLPNGTGITIVGDAGSTSHGLNTNDDLFIAGKLEVDGPAFFDGAVRLESSLWIEDNQPLYFGSLPDVLMKYGTSQTPDSLVLGIGAQSNAFIICEALDINVDFAHAMQTNPTLFIHGAGAGDITEWLSLSYGVIGTGKGNLQLAPAGDGVDIQGRLLETQGADVASTNDLTLGTDGSYFDIGGVTQINRIASAGWLAGSRFMLQFDGAVTVKDAQAAGGGFASVLITGSADYISAAGSILELVFDGTAFRAAPWFTE